MLSPSTDPLAFQTTRSPALSACIASRVSGRTRAWLKVKNPNFQRISRADALQYAGRSRRKDVEEEMRVVLGSRWLNTRIW
jgi:hypothetical protein